MNEFHLILLHILRLIFHFFLFFFIALAQFSVKQCVYNVFNLTPAYIYTLFLLI